MTYQEIERLQTEIDGLCKSRLKEKHECGAKLCATSWIRNGLITQLYCPRCDTEPEIRSDKVIYKGEQDPRDDQDQ